MNRRSAILVLLMIAVTPIIPIRAQYNGRLIVNQAVYGRNGQGADVTNRVRSMIRNNSLDFKVNNTNLGGDPNQGTQKALKLAYTYNGSKRTIVVNEGDRCRVP